MARLLVLVESLLAAVVLGSDDETWSSVDEERRRASVEETLVKVYVSGPISGYPNGNAEAFTERTKILIAGGFDAVNPHDCPPNHTGECVGRSLDSKPHKYGCYLRSDLRELLNCDAITMLPGWEESPGALVERSVALAVGLPVLTLGIDYCT